MNLARLLLQGFPGPAVRQDVRIEKEESGANARDRVETALQAMAEGEWTTEAEIVEFVGVDSVDLRLLVNDLNPVIARLIRGERGEIPEWFSAALRSSVEEQFSPSEPRNRVSSERMGELVRDVEQTIDDSAIDDTEIS